MPMRPKLPPIGVLVCSVGQSANKVISTVYSGTASCGILEDYNIYRQEGQKMGSKKARFSQGAGFFAAKY